MEVGSYPDLETAAQRALVCLALGAAYWLFEEEGRFVLLIEARDEPRLAPELAAFEREEGDRKPQADRAERVSPLSIFVFVWVMSGAFLLQAQNPDYWIRAGGTSRLATIDQGEWWRAFTALFLHGDMVHLGSNLFFGAIFAYATLRRLRPGLAWSAIVLAGVLGNLVNSALSLEPATISIGASTGVFAALGVLTASRAWDTIGRSFRVSARRLLVPLGGGFALLALYGSGQMDVLGQRIDYTAHLFGFLAGLLTGSGAWWVEKFGRGVDG